MDGALCDYTEEDQMQYLKRLQQAGVKNIEMEATAFGAITHAAGIRCRPQLLDVTGISYQRAEL